MNLWQHCDGPRQIGAVAGRLLRLVESQEQVATLGYVDSLAEQALLEELLEGAKPTDRCAADNLHYLLRTPFRYPPLQWGSRFGRVHEPAIFYGGLDLHTTLAETAYYRFVFWYSMVPYEPAPKAAPPKPFLRSEHTLFSVDYRSDKGVRLQQPPFERHRQALTDPADYSITQLLGSAMRDAGVEAFEYASARSSTSGLCVGLITPAALQQNRPLDMSQWLCELTADAVSFKHREQTRVHRFELSCFTREGALPLPAA